MKLSSRSDRRAEGDPEALTFECPDDSPPGSPRMVAIAVVAARVLVRGVAGQEMVRGDEHGEGASGRTDAGHAVLLDHRTLKSLAWCRMPPHPRRKTKAPEALAFQGLTLVAGAGFEPATCGSGPPAQQKLTLARTGSWQAQGVAARQKWASCEARRGVGLGTPRMHSQSGQMSPHGRVT